HIMEIDSIRLSFISRNWRRITMNQTYHVKLDAFEGPLDLLLHLIKQYEIDIYDIPVAQITEQYMEYIHTMQKLELNIASEFLVMAASLLALKSQMLLPKQEIEDDEEEYMEDPRQELMDRLIEYRKYKEASKDLKDREEDTFGTYTRPATIFEDLLTEQPVMRGDTSIYDMLNAVQKIFDRRKWDAPLETKIERREIPLQERMDDILTQVTLSQNGILFEKLLKNPSRPYVVASFIAILELMKAKEIHCRQESNFQSIRIFSMGDKSWKSTN